MLYQFDVRTENGKVHVFTKSGKDVKEAIDNIPLEADKRGIVHSFEIIETRTYQSGGIWINADGSVHKEVELEEPKDVVEEEAVVLEEDEGQLTLAL